MKPIIITWVILLIFLSGHISFSANAEVNLAKSLVQAGVEIIKYPTTLCILCIIYYGKFSRWPSKRKEFESCFKDLDDKDKKALFSLIQGFRSTGERSEYSQELFESEMKAFFKSIDYDFSQLKNGDLLIEGGFNEEITKSLGFLASSKRYFSIVGHTSEEKFSFLPSEKAERSRCFLKIKLNMHKQDTLRNIL